MVEPLRTRNSRPDALPDEAQVGRTSSCPELVVVSLLAVVAEVAMQTVRVADVTDTTAAARDESTVMIVVPRRDLESTTTTTRMGLSTTLVRIALPSRRLPPALYETERMLVPTAGGAQVGWWWIPAGGRGAAGSVLSDRRRTPRSNASCFARERPAGPDAGVRCRLSGGIRHSRRRLPR